MGTSLSGLTPATTFDGLLKVGDNDPLTTTLKTIGTGDGTDSQLKIATNSTQMGNIQFVSGNVITTTSPSTNLRIVSGSIAVNGDYSNPTANTRLHIKGSGATSATTSLLVQNSAGSDYLKVTDDGNVQLGSSISVQSTGISAYNSIQLKTFIGGGVYESGLVLTGNGAPSKVGIGETTPTAKLHVKGSGNDNTTTSLLVQNSDGTDIISVKDDLSVVFNSTITSASSTLRFDVGGVGTIRMNSDKVAIGGNTTPTARLHVKGSGATSATTALLVQNSAGDDMFKVADDSKAYINGSLNINRDNTQNAILLGNAAGSTKAIIHRGDSGGLVLQGGPLYYKNEIKVGFGQNDITFATDSSQRMVINPTGQIGMGETTPTARLQVKGSGNDNTTTALLVQNSDGLDMVKVTDDGIIGLNPSDSGAKWELNAANNYILSNVYAHYYDTAGFVNFRNANVLLGLGTNGAASTRVIIKGLGATSATTALLVQNSAGTELLKVLDDGAVSATTFYAGTSIIRQNSFRINQQWLVSGAGGQGLKIGTSNTAPDNSAKLEVDSTTQGFLPPRMTDAERDAIATPAAGLMIYDTSNNQMNYWNGSSWIAF